MTIAARVILIDEDMEIITIDPDRDPIAVGVWPWEWVKNLKPEIEYGSATSDAKSILDQLRELFSVGVGAELVAFQIEDENPFRDVDRWADIPDDDTRVF